CAARGNPVEAKHGAARLRLPAAGLRRRDRTRDLTVLPSPRTGGRSGDRLSLRRPVGGGGDEQAERDERARPAPVEAVVLLRPCSPGGCAQSLGRQGGERRGGTARLLPPGEDEQRSTDGHLRSRHGAGGGPGLERLAVLPARQGLELVQQVVRLDPAG